jgi:hypothetical protein
MRWGEIISEKLVHAQPLRGAITPGAKFKKATPLVPSVAPPPDPGTAIAMALPQIAQAVASGSQMAAQTAVQLDDAEEAQAAAQAAQEYQQAKKQQ